MRPFSIVARLGLICCVGLAACSAPDRATMTLPQQLEATVPRYENVRFFADDTPAQIAPFLRDFRPATGGAPQYLALSGGGEGGAFGAGVLVGWSQTGTRPDFDLVTGISAGALIAPFAFIGAEGDAALQQLFQSGIAERLNTSRSLIRGLLGKSLMESDPLKELIAAYVDDALLARVAARHRAGARLLVVTTNIDAERNVVWDMGAIAASGRPDAAALFGNVLAASASIPAIFPPISLPANADGATYQELHVDGGAIRQIYFFPEAFMAAPDWSGMGARRPGIYAIANNELTPRFEPVEPRAVSIAKSGFSSLVKSSLGQSLARMEDFAAAQGLAFRVMFIDRYIPSDPDRPFDPDYMRKAFALGQSSGQAGAWSHSVPIGTRLLETEPQS